MRTMLNMKNLPEDSNKELHTWYILYLKKKAYLLISHRIPILRGQKGHRQSAFNFKVCIITKVCEEE